MGIILTTKKLLKLCNRKGGTERQKDENAEKSIEVYFP